MQPCSREMQSLFHDQIQPPSAAAASFSDPTTHDDFLDQMLNSLPSSTWSPWDAIKSDESPPIDGESSYVDESAILASKLRHHQISGGTPGKMMIQQQMMMARALAAAAAGGDDGMINGGDANSPFKSPQGGGTGEALFNGFNPAPNFHNQHGGSIQPNFGAASQPQVSGGSTGGAPKQPRQRVRARRGQATDPHSIAERLRRERIAERMKGLQELVPNSNKTDKASMLDEIIDYVKFLQLQVKVLSMSRLGGAGAVAPLVADMSSEGGEPNRTNGNNNGNQTGSTNDNNNNNLTMTEHQVAKLMEEDMGSAMQYLQGKGLCLMPISLATAISTATCHTRMQQSNGGGGEGPSSPNLSVLTDGTVKESASVSKP